MRKLRISSLAVDAKVVFAKKRIKIKLLVILNYILTSKKGHHFASS